MDNTEQDMDITEQDMDIIIKIKAKPLLPYTSVHNFISSYLQIKDVYHHYRATWQGVDKMFHLIY